MRQQKSTLGKSWPSPGKEQAPSGTIYIHFPLRLPESKQETPCGNLTHGGASSVLHPTALMMSYDWVIDPFLAVVLGKALEVASAFEPPFVTRMFYFRAIFQTTQGNADFPGLHYPRCQESPSAGAEASWVKPQFILFTNHWLPLGAHREGKEHSSSSQVRSGSTNNIILRRHHSRP